MRASDWYTDFCWCHSITSIGFIFNGWADGRPLNEQEIMTVRIFSLIKDEITKRVKQDNSGS